MFYIQREPVKASVQHEPGPAPGLLLLVSVAGVRGQTPDSGVKPYLMKSNSAV